MKFVGLILKGLLFVLLTAAVLLKAADAPTVTVKGYVLDSACAFTKGLSKPISKQCATSCANTGSPLVILADDGTIYWPIADTMPSSGQNPKLLPFAGGKVTATGKVYQRGGSKAIVIEKIEAQPAQK
jgi:type 1 fimbria pilin